MNIARYALYSGTMAGLASLAVLMLAAKVEGKALPQPINATSHWIHGENAGQVTRWNARHTATGPVTHFASAMFWAVPFAAWYVWQRPRTFLHGFCGAAVLSAFAAFFGYRVISRPLTPGWERCRMCLWPRPSHPSRSDWQPAQGSRGRNREPAVTLLPGFPARIAELYRSYTGLSCHRQEQAMAKTQLQGPPIRKDGLQIDERRHFQEIFWTVERFAWIIFALILLLALLGLTGSGGYFAKTTQTLDAGTAEYARFSRWEASDEMRFTFNAGAGTHRLTIEPAFYEYLQVEGVQPAPERAFFNEDGLVMEFAAEQGAPLSAVLYYRPLRPGYLSYRVVLDGSAADLATVVLP